MRRLPFLLQLFITKLIILKNLESIAPQWFQGFLQLQDTIKDNKNQYLFTYFAQRVVRIDLKQNAVKGERFA